MNIKVLVTVVLCIAFFGGISCEKENSPENVNNDLIKYEPVDVAKTNSMRVYAHYMPWFDDKTTSLNGQWGMHWTMATQNPEIIDENNKRQIASWYYPLIGPYASSDPDLIEYHLLLMKYSGIEGILIDWYGASDVNDYGLIRRNAEALINSIEETGLKYAIVYEDRIVDQIVKQNPEYTHISYAQGDMLYLQKNYFTDNSYIKIDDKPLLLVFGPEYFNKPGQWEEIFEILSEKPLFLVLNYKSAETAPHSSGEYIWVDNSSLDNKYARKTDFSCFFGGAYPGFNDFYNEGGWGTGFDWSINFDNGITLQNTLNKAIDNNVEYLQLITWNDFGEGTMIEPTDEYEFSLLEIVQDFAGVSYTKNELEAIYNLYVLRKKYADNTEKQKELSQSFYYFVSLQTEEAISIIDSLKTLNK